MGNLETEFNGKDFVITNKYTRKETVQEDSAKKTESVEKEETPLYEDTNFEEELDTKVLEEFETSADKYLKDSIPERTKKLIKDRLEEAVKLAETNEMLKEHYKQMQRDINTKSAGDGGKDKTNPDYYRLREMESIDIMELKHGTLAVMSFCLLTSERYEYRVGAKKIQEGNSELDMSKADWYLAKYKELYKKIGTREEIIGLSSLL